MWNCSLPHGLGMFGGLGAALGFVFFAMALYFIVKAATKKDARGNHEKDRFDSLGILKMRLAKGEIGIEEFNNLKRFL